ncbi:MAG: AAA family ATPase [Chloroflexaceae bacterium]|nr:AAA family ATPase [Chloroflexaceae bacterium]
MDLPQSPQQWLKARRKALGLTQIELAQQVGCSKDTLNKIETARRRPSRAMALRLAQMLDVPPDLRESFVRALRVTRPHPSTTANAGAHAVAPPPGRAAACASLAAWLAPLATKQPVGVAVVVGVAGIGKSTLLATVQQQHPQYTWLRCAADPQLTQSLAPLQALVRQQLADPALPLALQLNTHLTRLAAHVTVHAPDHASEVLRIQPFLADLLDPAAPASDALSPRTRFANVQHALVTWLRAYSLHGPTVLVLEDTQWLDADTWHVLHQLSLHLTHTPLAILCTSSPDPATLLHFTNDGPLLATHWLQLEGLALADLPASVTYLLGAPASPAFARELHATTHGNPFHIEQLLALLAEQGSLSTHHRPPVYSCTADVDLTQYTLPYVLHQRLARLTADTRQIVQAAAVLGKTAELDLLCAMLQPDPLVNGGPEHLHPKLRDLHYLMRHALFWDAAYAMQSAAHLRELHLLAATTLERLHPHDLDAYAPALVYHFHHADDHAREWHYACRAGLAAAARYANTEALHYLNRALELTDHFDYLTQLTLLLAREQVHALLGNRSAQADDLHQLTYLANAIADPERQITVALRTSAYAEQIGDLDESLHAATYACALADTNQLPARRAEASHRCAQIYYRQGQFAPALAQIEHAAELARRVGDLRQEAANWCLLGNVTDGTGDLATAQRAYEQAIALHEQLHDQRGIAICLNNLGMVALIRHDSSLAHHALDRAVHIAQHIGDRWLEAGIWGNLIEPLRCMGDFATAHATCATALHQQQILADPYLLSATLAEQAILHLYADAPQAAAESAYAALAHADASGGADVRGTAQLYLGHALLALNDLEGAETAYQAAYQLRAELGQPHYQLDPLAGLAQVALAQEQVPQAQMYAADLLQQLTTNPALTWINEPIRIYLVCYRILTITQPKQALSVLRQAARIVQQWSARMPTPTRRQELEQHPLNRVVLAEASAHQLARPATHQVPPLPLR